MSKRNAGHRLFGPEILALIIVVVAVGVAIGLVAYRDKPGTFAVGPHVARSLPTARIVVSPSVTTTTPPTVSLPPPPAPTTTSSAALTGISWAPTGPKRAPALVLPQGATPVTPSWKF
jgi:hypothetical protein